MQVIRQQQAINMHGLPSAFFGKSDHPQDFDLAYSTRSQGIQVALSSFEISGTSQQGLIRHIDKVAVVEPQEIT